MLALGVALGASAAPAAAAEKAIWGPVDLSSGTSAFPMYEQLGVDVYQTQLDWDAIAPTRPANPTDPLDPAYRWPAQLTTAGSEASRHGIAVALLVTGAPAWSNGGKSRVWAPSDPADFASFLTAAAKRYSNVRRWMIWGEPNMALRFEPQEADSGVSARAYAPLLDAAYGALKAVNTRNIVIGGMTWTGGDVKPVQFVREMRLADGRRPRLDWFGHNPYPFRFPELTRDPFGDFRDISDLDTFGKEVDAAFRGSRSTPVKLWLSEFMIQSDQRSVAFDTFVSQGDQAAWLRAGYAIANSLTTRVAGMGWFTLVDQAPAALSSHWGLLTSALAPKPSWQAFRDVPSERFTPGVQVQRGVRLGTLRGRGLAVRLRRRSPGRHTVQLRRGTRVVRTVATTRASIVRLKLRTARPGSYTIRVLSPRGLPVSKTVSVS